MATFKILTLGCKVNTYESESYSESLKRLGYLESETDFADIYIINTCTVTNTAASKSRQKIHLAKKTNQNAIICVVGCLAQTDPNVEKEDVDLIIGSTHKNELAIKIDEIYKSRHKENLVENVDCPLHFEDLEINSYEHQTRAFLKIQDGCNQFCAYCQIPYARGRERSLSLEKVKDNAQRLLDNGHKEIVLSGIHTGRYCDENGNRLIDVLKALVEIGVPRIRISSIEITEITDEIIEFIKNHNQMARHLHIPMQAGSDRILKLMNRPYDREYFYQRVSKIQSEIKDIAIGTDIIVGFVSETDEEYQDTKDLAIKSNLVYLHVFPYSMRNGTKASTMNGHLDSSIKKARAKDLIALGEDLKNKYFESLLNHNLTVLFEREEDGYWAGHSSDYVKVYVESDKIQKGMIKNVKITSVYKDGLKGDIDVTE